MLVRKFCVCVLLCCTPGIPRTGHPAGDGRGFLSVLWRKVIRAMHCRPTKLGSFTSPAFCEIVSRRLLAVHSFSTGYPLNSIARDRRGRGLHREVWMNGTPRRVGTRSFAGI